MFLWLQGKDTVRCLGKKMLLRVEHSSVGITLAKKDGNSHTLPTVDTKYNKDKTLVDKFIFITLHVSFTLSTQASS